MRAMHSARLTLLNILVVAKVGFSELAVDSLGSLDVMELLMEDEFPDDSGNQP